MRLRARIYYLLFIIYITYIYQSLQPLWLNGFGFLL
jgi:hypothetical protein